MLTISSRVNNIIQLLFSIIIFVFVLAITWLVTKWIGNYQNMPSKHQNVEIIETARIANGKYIQIIRVAQEYIVIAVCKENVTFLTKLEENEIQRPEFQSNETMETFQEILKKIKTKKK